VSVRNIYSAMGFVPEINLWWWFDALLDDRLAGSRCLPLPDVPLAALLQSLAKLWPYCHVVLPSAIVMIVSTVSLSVYPSVRPFFCLSSSLTHSREVKNILTSLLVVVEDRSVNYFWRVLRTSSLNNNDRTREMNSKWTRWWRRNLLYRGLKSSKTANTRRNIGCWLIAPWHVYVSCSRNEL